MSAPKSPKDIDKTVTMLDEKGKEFDDLRGNNSIMFDFEKYLESNKGNYKILSEWMNGQGGSSWSPLSQSLKYFLSKQRNMSDTDFWWMDGVDDAKGFYDHYSGYKYGQKTYADTVRMYDAFTYEKDLSSIE